MYAFLLIVLIETRLALTGSGIRMSRGSKRILERKMPLYILLFGFFVFSGGAAFAQYGQRAPVGAQEECPQGRQIRAQKAYPSTMSDCEVLDADSTEENQKVQRGPAAAPSPPNRPPSVATDRAIPQPSFNCAQAKSAPARLICSDAELAQLDGELGAAFQKRKAEISARVVRGLSALFSRDHN